MYEPFPNYIWNLSINLALCMGGAIGEIDTANRTVMTASAGSEDGATEAFFQAWCAMADQLVEEGAAEAAVGHGLSAAQKYRRATIYYMTAERMQSRYYAPRWDAYRKMLAAMDKAVEAGGLNCRRVEVPYGDTSFPALFVRGHGHGARPCMVHCNGLDSAKEMIYWCGIADELAARGISTLILDHPGTGEALRLKGLVARVDAEAWAGAAVDYLQSRAGDVDPDRVGMMGWSLGGYYAPRAAAFEKRFKLCVAWGANHNWGEVQQARQAREGDRPVPHYWDHVMWVWGQDSLEAFMAFCPAITLEGVVDKITVPFLVTHGAGDRQIPVRYAHQSFDQATASPTRELRIFDAKTGGVEHCSADNMEPVRSFIADWVSDRFQELQRPAERDPKKVQAFEFENKTVERGK